MEALRVLVVPEVPLFVGAELRFLRREATSTRVAAASTCSFLCVLVVRVVSDCCAQFVRPSEQLLANVLCSTYCIRLQEFIAWDPCYTHFPDGEDEPPSAVLVLYVRVES